MRRGSASQKIASLPVGLLVLIWSASALATGGSEDASVCAAQLERDLSAMGWSVSVEYEVPPHVQSVVDHVCARRRESRADVWIALDGTRGHVEAPFVDYRRTRQMVRRALATDAPLCALGAELVKASRQHVRLRWTLLAGFLFGTLLFVLLFGQAVRTVRNQNAK